LALMEQHPEAVRAQILIARDEYKKAFGRKPRHLASRMRLLCRTRKLSARG
jgi:hypothetical protein